MVSKNIHDDLKIHGSSDSTVAYIQKPVEKTIALQGTVNIVSGGAGTHNSAELTISGVAVRQHVNGVIQSITYPAVTALTGLNGIITTASMTTVANSKYPLVLTHDSIAVGDLVIVSCQYANAGAPLVVVKTIAANAIDIDIHNAGGTTFNGIAKIHWQILKA